jgi:hypothetical protein
LADKEVTVKLGLDSKEYESKITKASQATKGISANWAQAASGLKDLGSIVGDVAEKLGEFAKYAGKVDSVASSFNSLAASSGKSGQAIIDSMSKATRGTVDTMKMMESASMAINLMGSQVVEKLPMLAEIAMASARASGKETAEMLNDVIVAAGRQSVQILDNLGISSATAAKYQEDYAKSLGKTREQLNDTQKSAAFFYAVEKAGGELVKKLNLDNLTFGETLQVIQAQTENTKQSFAQGMLPGLRALAGEVAATGGTFSSFGSYLGQSFGTELVNLKMRVDEVRLGFAYMKQAIDLYKDGAASEAFKQDTLAIRRLIGDIEIGRVRMLNYGNTAAAAYTQQIVGVKTASLATDEEYAKKYKLLNDYNQYHLSYADFMAINERERLNQGKQYYQQVVDEKLGIDRAYWQDVAGVTSTASVFMAEENKGLFAFGKTLAVGEAIINSHLAATKALAQLGVWGGVAAAAIIYAAGFLRVKQIMAQKPPSPPKSKTPKFEEGVIGVPHDMFAQIHQGETIVPKNFTEAIKSGDMTLAGPGSSPRVIQLVVDGKVLGEVTDNHRDKTARRMGRSNYGGSGVYN